MGQFTLNAGGDKNIDAVNGIGIFLIIVAVITVIGIILVASYAGTIKTKMAEEDGATVTEEPSTTTVSAASALPAGAPIVIYAPAPSPARPVRRTTPRTTKPPQPEYYDDEYEDVPTTRRRTTRRQVVTSGVRADLQGGVPAGLAPLNNIRP